MKARRKKKILEQPEQKWMIMMENRQVLASKRNPSKFSDLIRLEEISLLIHPTPLAS